MTIELDHFQEKINLALPAITLVIGGASSGKSSFAEAMVHDSGLAKTYLATAQAFDDEMKAKIEAHREARAGFGWRTVETPLELAKELAQLDSDEVALVDCASLWLSNIMFATRDWEGEAEELCEVLELMPNPAVIVTNEVGHGIVPENKLAREFRDAHGQLNQILAAQADLVVLVIAGLPMVLKGNLPEGFGPW